MLEKFATSLLGLPDIWQGHERAISPLIGSPGYSLPEISSLKVARASEARKEVSNLHIEGDNLEDNWIVYPEGLSLSHRLIVTYSRFSKSNILIISRKADITGSIKFYASSGISIFGENMLHISTFHIIMSRNNQTFFWGKDGSSNGLTVHLDGEAKEVVIGDDCMVAQKASILSSDVHAMIDRKTGQWINAPASVTIEPHVWLAMECMVLKGSRIGSGSVIGARAVVSGNIPRNSIAAGAPAKAIRNDITWIRPNEPNKKAIEDVEAAMMPFLNYHGEI